MRHTLGVFFPLYACEDASHQESLYEALMPTLQTLIQAPVRSPLASVDIENVTNFLVSITSPTILSEESEEVSTDHLLMLSITVSSTFDDLITLVRPSSNMKLAKRET